MAKKSIFCLMITTIAYFLMTDFCSGKGIIPDRVNQIIIYSDTKDTIPTFYLVFSANSLPSSIQTSELKELLSKNNDDKNMLAIKVYGKKATKSGRFDYFFGTKYDPEMPWNNGKDLHWKDWEKYSDEIWDNIAIGYEPQNSDNHSVKITNIAIKRGGQLLLDTRVKGTYLNNKKISFKVPSKDIMPKSKTVTPLLSLSYSMKSFKKKFYEVKTPLLEAAYMDLGQTDKSKYANRGTAWCSEFASYLYRKYGYETPDPNKVDVYWKNLREYFIKSGNVYTLREVTKWSDSKKKSLIKPGAVVSIITDAGQTHTIIFSNWIYTSDKIESFTGISGCNRGMVWAHSPLLLPTDKDLSGKTKEELEQFDEKCFFGVVK